MSLNGPPDPTRCPECDTPLASQHCERCGLTLSGPAAGELWRIDNELHRLHVQRSEVVALLRADSVDTPPVPVPAGAPTVGSPPPPRPPSPTTSTLDPPVPTAPPAPSVPSGPPPPAPVTSKPLAVPTLLLGLGVLSLAVAAIIFAAVAWGSLGEVVQVALLLGTSTLFGVASVGLARHELDRTAEAFSVLATLVALVAVGTTQANLLDDVSGVLVWAGGLAIVAAGTFVLHRATSLTSPAVLAVTLVNLPLVLGTIHLADTRLETDESRFLLLGAVMLMQSIIWPALAQRIWPRVSRTVMSPDSADGGVIDQLKRPGVVVWAAMIGLLQAVFTLIIAITSHQVDGVAIAGSLLLAAIVAMGATVAWRSSFRGVTPLIAAGAVTAGSFLPASVARNAVDGITLGLLTVLASGALIGTFIDVVFMRRDRGGSEARNAALIAFFIGSLSAVPLLLQGLSSLAIGGDAWSEAWTFGLGTTFEDLSSEVEFLLSTIHVWGFAVVLLLAGSARFATRSAAWTPIQMIIAAALIPAMLASPGRSVILTIGVALLLAGAGLGSVVLRRHAAIGGTVLALASFSSLVWAPMSEATTVGVLGVLTAIAIGAAAIAAIRSESTATVGATTLAVTGIGALVVVVPAAFGASTALGWSLLALTASAWGLGALAARARGLASVALTLEFTAVLGATLGAVVLLATGSTALAATMFAVAAFAAVVHSLTGALPGPATVVAATFAVAASWTFAGHRGIDTLEAYTVPLGVALLIAGWRLFAGRSSWLTSAAGVAVILVPTVLVAYLDGGVERSIAAGLGSALAVAIGSVLRRQAPLAIGTACLVAIVGHQLFDLVAEVPRWIVFGAIGIALLALGATYEQRARDLSRLGRKFLSLS